MLEGLAPLVFKLAAVLEKLTCQATFSVISIVWSAKCWVVKKSFSEAVIWIAIFWAGVKLPEILVATSKVTLEPVYTVELFSANLTYPAGTVFISHLWEVADDNPAFPPL